MKSLEGGKLQFTTLFLISKELKNFNEEQNLKV